MRFNANAKKPAVAFIKKTNHCRMFAEKAIFSLMGGEGLIDSTRMT